MDEPIPTQEENQPLPEAIDGAFRFDDMSFGYMSYQPVLENVTVDIHPGEKIGLVGRSGAGKSTFVNLVMRLYQPDEGVIYLDGHPLDTLDPKSYHEHLGVVLQESFLFSGTVAQILLMPIRMPQKNASSKLQRWLTRMTLSSISLMVTTLK